MASLIQRLGPVNCCVIKATPLLSNLTVSLTRLRSWGHPRPQTRLSGMPSKPRRSSFTVGDQDRRRRGRGRSPGQHDQCWKWNIHLLNGPARRYHCQQSVRGVVSDLSRGKILSHHFLSAHFCVYFFSLKKLVGLQEAGLCSVLSWRSDRLPHRGSAPPFSRLLLGVHWRGSFCSPAGESTDFPSTASAA